MGIYRHTIYAIITLCVMFHLSFLLVQITLCQPARRQWDPAVVEGSCLPGVPVYTSMASITLIFDVTVLVAHPFPFPPHPAFSRPQKLTPVIRSMLLPFPVLVKSRIQTRKKLILLGLFGLGVFITVIQIVRIQTVKQLANYIDSAPLILWSAVENNLGIIVANVPTLAPLVKYYNERGSKGAAGYSENRRTGGPGGMYAQGGSRGGTAHGTGTGGGGGRSGQSGKGMETLVGSSVEMDSYEGERHKGNGSTDSILDSCSTSGGGEREEQEKSGGRVRVRSGLPGITKKVEVVITRT